MSEIGRRAFLETAGLGALAVPSAVATPASPASPPLPKPFDRAQATEIIAAARKIVTPNGVERLETVRIGGIEQWVSVRGSDRRNPVLLHIHGGPGYVSIPMSWWFARGWEEYFTVVQWDQRGAGKTYLINDPATVAPTMTLERMIADALEVANWARSEFGKQKIVVVGHSFGSYLGLRLAERHPEILHAYVGVGQVSNGPESERRGWAFAMDAARRAGNARAVAELEAIAPYAAPGHPPSLQNIYRQRRWLEYYGGAMAYRHGTDAEGDLSKLSPDYTAAEIARIWDGNEFSEKFMLAEVLSLDVSGVRRFECPMIVFAGRHDYNVSAPVAEEWFATVAAPSKQFVWFENSAHLPMTEEPSKYLLSLVRYARPFAESAERGAA